MFTSYKQLSKRICVTICVVIILLTFCTTIFQITFAEEVESQEITEETNARHRTDEEVAVEVMNGFWGGGEARRNALVEQGYDPDTIQTLVDQYYNPSAGIFAAVVFVSEYGVVPDPIITVAGEQVEIPEEPTDEMHAFTGWYTDDTYSAEFDFESPIDETVVIYANWDEIEIETEPSTFLVTFQNDVDSTKETAEIEAEQTVGYRYPSQNAGVVFDAWYTDADFTNEYNFDSPVTSDITLYAHYRPTNYIIIYDGNGGDGTMQNQTIEHDETATIAKNQFTKEGYTFSGWNNKADGTGVAFQEDESITNLVNDDGAKITLYAQWEEPYHVKEGVNQEASAGSDILFVINADVRNVVNISVDNTELSASTYDIWSNDEGLYVTLQADYTSRLNPGSHTILFNFNDGQCSTTFTIAGEMIQDKQGLPIWMIGVGGGIIIAGLLIFLFVYKNKKSKNEYY